MVFVGLTMSFVVFVLFCVGFATMVSFMVSFMSFFGCFGDYNDNCACFMRMAKRRIPHMDVMMDIVVLVMLFNTKFFEKFVASLNWCGWLRKT